MCLAMIVETRNGPKHEQCVMELYGIVNFLGTSKQKFIYWCSHCEKIEGSSLTPEQLFKEWKQKGIKFEVTEFAET